MAHRVRTKFKGPSDRAEYWRELNQAWEASDQTAVAFCRQRHVNPGTFAWWRRELARRDGVTSGRVSTPSFVEVKVGSGPVGRGYELALGNGRRIIVPGDFEETTLRRLLSVAEEIC
jgi:hypothetical protein